MVIAYVPAGTRDRVGAGEGVGLLDRGAQRARAGAGAADAVADVGVDTVGGVVDDQVSAAACLLGVPRTPTPSRGVQRQSPADLGVRAAQIRSSFVVHVLVSPQPLPRHLRWRRCRAALAPVSAVSIRTHERPMKVSLPGSHPDARVEREGLDLRFRLSSPPRVRRPDIRTRAEARTRRRSTLGCVHKHDLTTLSSAPYAAGRTFDPLRRWEERSGLRSRAGSGSHGRASRNACGSRPRSSALRRRWSFRLQPGSRRPPSSSTTPATGSTLVPATGCAGPARTPARCGPPSRRPTPVPAPT